jgi:hypothetical protein
VNRYLDNPALTAWLPELIAYSALPRKALEFEFGIEPSFTSM